MAGLHFDITGDNSNFLRKLDEARNGVRSTSKQIEESGTSIEQMFGRIAKGAATLGAGFSAQQFASQIMRVRGEFQQLEVAFKTMLGSKEEADALMQQLVKTAAITPFDLQSVAGGAKQLLAYGVAADDVNDTLIRVGDIAAGLSIPLNDLVYLYGTTMTQGRLFTQDLRQFQGRGIPLADELAKQFGVAKDKVGELVTAGKVGFPEVQKAIIAMTSDGGKFGGLMEAQSKTITGQISNIEDSISTMYNNIGKSSEGMINDALSGVSYFVANYEQVGKTIMELAVAYGAYKAVLISVAAYQSFAVGVTYSAEIAELSKLIPLKQQSANQDVIAAVASGKLTQSKAEQVIALRAEIAAKMQSMQATEAQTKAEYASAMASYKNATQRMLLAKQNMAIAQSQMSIAVKSGTVEEIAAAKKNAQTASIELNNAAIAKNTAHKGVNIAETNSKSASEALNTVQTGLNTGSQKANTISTNILTAAKTKLAAASRALGLSMLANPYVLVTAAVVGLGYAIYKTVTAETELDKAHKRLSDVTSDVENGLASEVSKLTSLERKMAETKKGTEEYNTIKKTIVDNYGQYYKGLDGEIERVGNLSAVYGKLVESMRMSIGQRKFESFFKAEQDNLDKTIGEKLDTAYNTLIDKYGKTKGVNLYNQFFDSSMRGTALSPSVIKDLQDATFMDMKWGDNAKNGFVDVENSVFDLRHEIKKEMKATEEILDEYKSKFQITEKEFANMFSGNKAGITDKTTENKTIEQLISDIGTAKKELKSLQKQANKGLISSDKVKEQSDALSKLTADYKLRTGKEFGSEKPRKQNEKLIKLTDKNSREQIRAEEDLQNQVDQSRIDAMKDGSDKTMGQMQLNHKKEMQQFEREKEDKLRKAIDNARAVFDADNKNKGKTFNASNIKLSDDDNKKYSEQKVYLEIKQFGEVQMLLYKERQSWNDYLAEYGSFQEKRQAITTIYNEKIASASTDGEKGSLKKELENKQKDLNIEELKSSINFADIFGNLDTQSTELLSIMRDKLKEVINKSAKDLKPTDLKALQDAFKDIDFKISERSPFNELKQGAKEYITSTKDVIHAQEDLNTVMKGGEVIVGTYIDSTGKLCTKLLTQEKAEKNLSTAQSNRQTTLSKLTKAANSIGSKGTEVVNAGNEIVGMLENFGVAVPEAVGETLNGIGQIMSALENIDITKPFSAVTSAIGVLAGIGNTIAGLFGFSKNDYSHYNEMVEQYDTLNTIWDELIDKKKEYIDTSYGEEANKAGREALELAQKSIESYKILGKERLNAGASSGSHSIGVRIKKGMSDEGWDEAKKSLGWEFDKVTDGRMEGLFNLSIEQLDKLKSEAPTFWAKLDDDVRGYLDNIIQGEERLEDIQNQLKEQLTQVSFDSVFDSFTDTLMDMDSSAEDFSNNFEEYMQRAILTTMVGDKYKEKLKGWYDNFAKANDDKAGITKDELDKSQKEWDSIVADAVAERDKLKDVFGWTSDKSTSQSSTKGGFETISQDTGAEISGRLTAFNESNEEIKNSMLSMLVSINLMSVSVSNNGIVLLEIRNLMISSNSYLEDIAKYTKALMLFGDKLDSIANNTKGLTSR